MNIVITGSIAYDYIMHFPGHFTDHILPESLEKLTLSFHVHEMSRHWGGTGANIAYTYALLGERPKLVGSAGKDFADYQSWLDTAGVDTSTIRVYDDVFSGSFFANTDLANRQIAFFYGGAMDKDPEVTLEDMVGGQADLVTISPTHTDAMMGYVAECKRFDIPYLFDPGQQIIRLSDDEIREATLGATLLAVNDYEYDMVLKRTDLSADKLAETVETIIITRGKDGADILHQGGNIHVPTASPEQVLDPTGAGDAFRGGFLKGLAEGWPMELTGRIGSLAATYTIEGRGPQSHQFTPGEFAKRFRRAFPDFDDEGALDTLKP
jgi:adenosine kinase